MCGVAVAYEPIPRRNGKEPVTKTGRPQGSLYSQQKRKIADACEYLRLHSEHKPIIFVATSPGFTNAASENSLISKLTKNLTNGYACANYVWVREFTKAGYPHFHFVADMPDFDVVKLSLYWSSLFGSDSKASIRLGTAPDKNGKRKYYLTQVGRRGAWYLTKYLGKDIGKGKPGTKVDTLADLSPARSFRRFHVSKSLAELSQPLIYGEEITTLMTGLHQRDFTLSNDMIEEGIPYYFNAKKYRWKWTGHGQTYIGAPRSWFRKRSEAAP